MPILSNFPGGSSSGSSGITLSAVTNITTQVASEKVYVKWTDPDDVTLGGTTLATWDGTLLVRKAGSTPTSRKDGTIILDSKTRNAYSSSYFCDSGLANDTTYYYKFFPYTTDGAYTDSADDAFDATPNTEVTGFSSWVVSNIVASSEAGNGKMTVKWTDPAANITNDGVTLATWAGTTIVVKTGSYPTSKDETTNMVYTLKTTTRNQYSSSALTITGLTNGTTYYIGFFPETADGGVNSSTTQRTTGVANRITISTVPSQKTTLTYTGSSQSVTWNNYNTTYMTVGGTTSGTNAGSYIATFTPKTDYRWSGGSTAAKSVTWTIGKATGTLTVSKTSISLDSTTTSTTFTVGGNFDGTMSYTASPTGIVTLSASGKTITVTAAASGTTTITVKAAAGTNYTAPSSKTVSVTVNLIPSELNDATWAQISSVSSSGTGANYWSVGDCKAVTLNGTVGTLSVNGTYYVYILGFNHNSAIEGTGITFGTFSMAQKNGESVCLVDSLYGSEILNVGKYFSIARVGWQRNNVWKDSYMRYDILGSTDSLGEDASSTTATTPVSNTLMAALPSDLRAVMKPMTVYTDNATLIQSTATSTNVSSTKDYLPLLAPYEITGKTSTMYNSYEADKQAQYDYYKVGNSQGKLRHDNTSATANYWLRSVCIDTTLYFMCIQCGASFAQVTRGSVYYDCGIAPIFRV